MYSIRYLPSADKDMEDAETYWVEHHPPVADKLADALEQGMDALIKNPFMYRVCEAKPYFRCMPLPHEYLCFYHVDETADMISVHRILRGMQDLNRIMEPQETLKS